MDVHDIIFAMIGYLIGVALIGASAFSIGVPPTSLHTSDDCNAGEREVRGIWASLLLTLMFIVVASYFALVGKMKISNHANLTLETPTNDMPMSVIGACVSIMLGTVTASVEIFFVLELRYKKFLCLPLLIQFIVSTSAFVVLFVLFDLTRRAYMMRQTITMAENLHEV